MTKEERTALATMIRLGAKVRIQKQIGYPSSELVFCGGDRPILVATHRGGGFMVFEQAGNRRGNPDSDMVLHPGHFFLHDILEYLEAP